MRLNYLAILAVSLATLDVSSVSANDVDDYVRNEMRKSKPPVFKEDARSFGKQFELRDADRVPITLRPDGRRPLVIVEYPALIENVELAKAYADLCPNLAAASPDALNAAFARTTYLVAGLVPELQANLGPNVDVLAMPAIGKKDVMTEFRPYVEAPQADVTVKFLALTDPCRDGTRGSYATKVLPAIAIYTDTAWGQSRLVERESNYAVSGVAVTDRLLPSFLMVSNPFAGLFDSWDQGSYNLGAIEKAVKSSKDNPIALSSFQTENLEVTSHALPIDSGQVLALPTAAMRLEKRRLPDSTEYFHLADADVITKCVRGVLAANATSEFVYQDPFVRDLGSFVSRDDPSVEQRRAFLRKEREAEVVFLRRQVNDRLAEQLSGEFGKSMTAMIEGEIKQRKDVRMASVLAAFSGLSSALSTPGNYSAMNQAVMTTMVQLDATLKNLRSEFQQQFGPLAAAHAKFVTEWSGTHEEFVAQTIEELRMALRMRFDAIFGTGERAARVD